MKTTDNIRSTINVSCMVLFFSVVLSIHSMAQDSDSIYNTKANITNQNIDSDKDIYAKVLELETAGNFKDAILLVSELIQNNVNTSKAYAKRGLLYAKLYFEDKAMADFDMAMSLDPENTEILNQRARINYEWKNYEDAYEDFLIIAKINPFDGKNYYNLGLIALNFKNKTLAYKNMKKALELNYNEANKIIDEFELKNIDADSTNIASLFP